MADGFDNLDGIEKGSEGYEFPEEFTMPEWLKGADFLIPEEKQEMAAQTEKIARKARAKRERFAVLFEDREGWKDEFGPDSTKIG